jgi:hypothetical protein
MADNKKRRFNSTRTAILGGLALLVAGYVLAAALYWPAFPRVAGIQQPLHYNHTYIWPMPWTLHQAAPGIPDPAPLTLRPGDAVQQGFEACADRLAMVRVWLAGARGGEEVVATLSDGEGWTHTGRLRLASDGVGRAYALRFAPLPDSAGRTFTLRLEAVEGTVVARVGYVDPIPGRLRVNEFVAPGDLDLQVYHRGLPGRWTLCVLGERLLPMRVRVRVRQYKPSAFKGATFGLLCAALALGIAAWLWATVPLNPYSPASRDSRSPASLCRGLVYATAIALLSLLLAIVWAWRIDLGGMLALGPGIRLAPGGERYLNPAPGASVYDLVSRLEGAGRQPEPRHVEARLATLQGTQHAADRVRAAIAVPAASKVTYGLLVPPDAELRLGTALPAGAIRPLVFTVQVEDDVLLETEVAPHEAGRWRDRVLDLRPYAGQQVRLSLVTREPGADLAFAGMPSTGALPAAGLWGAPQVTSARTWLSGTPPTGGPASGAPLARYGDQVELLAYEVNVRPVGDGATQAGDMSVTLYWRALRPVDAAYTVFVHLLDAEGAQRAQADAQPLGGAYPTDAWPPGLVVRDAHDVRVPAGALENAAPANAGLLQGWRLAVGLYDLATMDRLPVYDAGGAPLPDDRVLLELER